MVPFPYMLIQGYKTHFATNSALVVGRLLACQPNIVQVIASRIIYGETPSLHRKFLPGSRVIRVIQMARLSGGL